jgi:hypothetical protein
LLVEPYDVVADVMADMLDQLGFKVTVIASGTLRKNPSEKDYRCILINLDQNNRQWRDQGLKLAEVASKVEWPVVMIPDHGTAAATSGRGDQPPGRRRRCRRPCR